MFSLATIALAAHILVCGVEGISVPTGKETPITPARPTQPPAVPRVTRAPAPVHEYTHDNPEPPPLDPSWIPQTYKYINALRPEAIVYVPVRVKVPITNNQPEIDTRFVAVKGTYPVKVVDYEALKRQYVYQQQEEESKPQEYNYFMKKPYNKPSKTAYLKDYIYRQDRPTKGSYPKKATAYPEQSKYYYFITEN